MFSTWLAIPFFEAQSKGLELGLQLLGLLAEELDLLGLADRHLEQIVVVDEVESLVGVAVCQCQWQKLASEASESWDELGPTCKRSALRNSHVNATSHAWKLGALTRKMRSSTCSISLTAALACFFA